jgi:predicted DNA binding CopG/RHH family protein
MKKKTSISKKLNPGTLTADERAIERALAADEYVSVPALSQEIKRAQTIAQNTARKTRAINIRISERDLVRLRAAALREGVPYQTYVASLIHRSVG